MGQSGRELNRAPCSSRILRSVRFRIFVAHHSCNCTYKFTIDIRPDSWYAFACYLEQTSHTACVTPALTLAVSYYCKLFVAVTKVNSFGIKQIHTLSAKHRGWDIPPKSPLWNQQDADSFSAPCLQTSYPTHRRRLRLESRFRSRPSLFAFRFSYVDFVAPLFSQPYELLFPQPLYFHNHPNCPGVSPQTHPCKASPRE